MHAGGSSSLIPDYFPPVVPGTDDASSHERPSHAQASGFASALEEVV